MKLKFLTLEYRHHLRNLIILMALISMVVIVAGCMGSSPRWIEVIDTTEIIEDGSSITYHLDEGKYNIMIVSDVELNIEIIGTPYQASGVTEYSKTVTLDKSASLKIENPSLFGMGKSTTVTITIEKEIF